jgi:hypothetical protein
LYLVVRAYMKSSASKSTGQYAFLRGALKRVGEAKPFRGPEKYEDHMIYINNVEGDLGRFMGIEKILYKGKEIYKLLYRARARDSLEVFRFDFCSLMVAMFDSMRLVHSFQSELANELDVVPQGIRTYNLIIFY